MKRVLLTLSFFIISFCCSSQQEIIRVILEKDPLDRVSALFNVIDTTYAVKTSPAEIDNFLLKLSEEAARQKDHRLIRYLRYFREIKPVLSEKDGEKRVKIYEKAQRHFSKAGDKLFEGICLYYLGQENFILGNYGAAFDESVRSVKMFREVGYDNITEIGRYLHGTALNYYFFRDYAKVLEIMAESLKYRPYNPNLDVQRYNTIALAHRNLGQLDSARSYFDKTIKRAEFYGDSTWIALASGNLGALYAQLNQPDEALSLLQLDYTYNQRNLQMPDMARNAALAIAEIWLQKQRPDSAMHYLKASDRLQKQPSSAYLFGEQQRNEEYLRSYYGILSRYYEQYGSHQLAYQYLDSLHVISQELDKRYNSMLAKRAEDRLSIQQYMSDIELERQRRKTITTRWGLVFSVLLLCTLSIGLLYFLNRVKQSKQRVVQKLKENEILAEKQLTMVAFERAKDQLRYQLGLLEEKSLLIDQLQNELDQANSENGSASDMLEETLRKLGNARLLTQEDWMVFKHQFNGVFNNSLEELKVLHPDLTQSEERIFALMQLDIDTRQMASMLGISPESVRKARYRLNKKLKNA